jgi:hypothetical protein
MPDKTALTGLGAIACASGSQTWTGNIAVLTMKETAYAANATITAVPPPTSPRRDETSAMLRLPVSTNSCAVAKSMSSDDTAPMKRYLSAANAARPRPPTATSA